MKRFTTLLILSAWALNGFAQTPVTGLSPSTVTNSQNFNISLDVGGGDLSKAISILLLLTVLSLAPSIIMMMTSFTRIMIVLSFFKQAMGVQAALSGKLLAALSLFLTFFVMEPVWQQMYQQGLAPYNRKEISQTEAIKRGAEPLKKFMVANTRESCMLLFMELGNVEPVESPTDLSLRVMIPAFMVSELKTAFQMAFLLYLPFLAIDMLVATLLMALGMMMLPPVMISMPFKLLLFIMVGGWELMIKVLVTSFVT